ncbi:MAG TPA: amidase domain-containing protein [Bacilli bacterium]
MSQGWNSMLYKYVQCRNQMEAILLTNPLEPLLADPGYLQLQQKRLERLEASYIERNIKPMSRESRARFLRVHEREHKVIVDLELRSKLEHQLGPQEERIEKERVTLTNHLGQWMISQVEVKDYESGSPFPANDRINLNKSIPYLNQHYFANMPSTDRSILYDRHKVQQYADTWWDKSNPQYLSFGVDCSNYVSQCLFAGGAPMHYTGKRETGWWYKGRTNHQEHWSFSWAVAHSLQSYLSYSISGLRANVVDYADQLTIGDVIVYDWDGDAKYQHSAIVSAMDPQGQPLVNAHTMNSKHRFWDYRDSYAWSEKTQYRFLHILDSL